VAPAAPSTYTCDMLLYRFADAASWIGAAVGELREAARQARAAGRGRLDLCLAGGTTPEPVYRAMAALALQGLDAHLWLGDERAVPPADPARNGAMIERAFEACAWEPYPGIRLWPEAATEAEAEEAAAAYESELAAALGARPAFDLAMLGLGADGHTASLFPGRGEGSAARSSPRGLAAVAVSPTQPALRMTLTFAALAPAARRVFVVRGPDKLGAVGRLAEEDPALPASALAGPGSIILYLED
jgi:6-phosphogluconolactonase